MIKRRFKKIIQDALQRSPSEVVIVPRQGGKTTIALNISESTSFVLAESRLDLEKVRDIWPAKNIYLIFQFPGISFVNGKC